MLPYEFDTATVWRWIVQAILGLGTLLLLAIIGSLVTGKPVAALPLIFALVVLVVIGFRARNVSMGAVGTLTRTEVVTRRVNAFGIALNVPEGRYAIETFRAIRLEQGMAGPDITSVQSAGRVYLVGRDPVPEIQIFSGDDKGAADLARQLSESLKLECIDSRLSGATGRSVQQP